MTLAIQKTSTAKNKDYKNILFILFKKSEASYYNQCFKANMNIIKNIWKEIKSAVTIKSVSSYISKSLIANNTTTTNQV